MDQLINVDLEILIKDLGLEGIDQESKMKVWELFKANVDARLEIFLGDLIESDEEAQKLNLAAENPEIIVEYFTKKKGVDFPLVLAELTLQVREDLMKDVAFIQGMIAGKEES
jgi:hypothetical protein